MRQEDNLMTSRKRISDGDLVRVPAQLTQGSGGYLYGTVIGTTRPMRDDPEWTDHRILWHYDGFETIEWCVDLELVSDE